MNTITTTLTTEAIFSDDGLKRYTLCKTWDTSLSKLAIIMLARARHLVLYWTQQRNLSLTMRLGWAMAV